MINPTRIAKIICYSTVSAVVMILGQLPAFSEPIQICTVTSSVRTSALKFQLIELDESLLTAPLDQNKNVLNWIDSESAVILEATDSSEACTVKAQLFYSLIDRGYHVKVSQTGTCNSTINGPQEWMIQPHSKNQTQVGAFSFAVSCADNQ